MKLNTITHFGTSECKYSIYSKKQPVGRDKGERKFKMRYFLRATPSGSTQSTEVRITSRQVLVATARLGWVTEIDGELQEAPRDVIELTAAQCKWAAALIRQSRRPQSIRFTPREAHIEDQTGLDAE
jgi:hypothetical protein